ncbi:hypothetical protein BOC36_08655 [Burkholderia pseudomallei]|nr:hypothetical protein BOC36_08655 [Burkholderia pseudomallei]
MNGYVFRYFDGELYGLDLAVVGSQGRGRLSSEHHRARVWFCSGIRAPQAFSRMQKVRMHDGGVID